MTDRDAGLPSLASFPEASRAPPFAVLDRLFGTVARSDPEKRGVLGGDMPAGFLKQQLLSVHRVRADAAPVGRDGGP